MLDIKVGDTVMCYSHSRSGGTEETVTRVGRKYFYVERYGREEAYSLENGATRSQYSGRAKTLDQVALERRGQEAMDTLKAHGVVLDSLRARKLSTEQLEALAEVARTFPKA